MVKEIVVLITGLILFPAMASAEPVLTDFVYIDDFEDGSVGSWTSYPPAQDTAYDPTIWVRPLRSAGDVPNRALYREIQPNYKITCEFGVREKFNLYVNNESSLSFRCMISCYTGTEGLSLRFGFRDGTDITFPVPFTETGSWRNVSINFSDFIGNDDAKKLDAIAFMAVCPNADPETVLKLGIDDVRISGNHEAEWIVTSPSVHKLAERKDLIAGRHFRAREDITITSTAPCSIERGRLTVSRALTGEDKKSFPMKGLNGDALEVTIKDGPEPGFWRAVLEGETIDNKTVMTSFVFLVRRSDIPNEHPRLFISKQDIPEILDRAGSEHLKNVRDSIRKRAEDLRNEHDVDSFNYNLDAYDDIYWLPTFGGYYGAIWIPNSYIRENAVEYALSGDETAGEAARRGLLKLAAWPTFVHHHILNQGQNTYWPAAIMLSDLALSFDLVYDSMSDDEKRTVANTLFEKGIKPVFEEYVRDNRVSSSTSNWISDAMGAIILSSAAVSEEYDDTELEPYLSGAILRLGDLIHATFDPDGAYGEGALYYSHALHCLTKSMPVLERLYNVHFPDDLIRNSHYFLIYQSDEASGRIYDFGDAFESISLFKNTGYLGFGNFAWLIGKYRDPHLKWFYDLNPGMTERDLFFLDESVAPEPPDALPKVKYFHDAGTAVFRSGFAENDFIFVFRCGAFYNHHHFDQGSFFLSDNGETYITESGRTDYYTDPWYQKLYIQAGGHSTIIVDGNPESQRAGDFLHDVPAWKNRGEITDFIAFDGGACVSGRLDPLYKGMFQLLRRTALYFVPRTVVLVDQAVGDGDTETISLRFHTRHRDDILLEGNNARISRPGGILDVTAFGPDGMDTGIVKRPMTLNEFAQENAVTMKARGFLEQSMTLGHGNTETCFVNVLTTDRSVTDNLDPVNTDNCLKLSIGDKICYINKKQVSYTSGGITTDALAYIPHDTGFTAIRTKTLTVDNKIVLKADTPVSLSFSNGDIQTLSYSASEETVISLALDHKPGSITLYDEILNNWRYDSNTGFLYITLQPGQGDLILK